MTVVGVVELLMFSCCTVVKVVWLLVLVIILIIIIIKLENSCWSRNRTIRLTGYYIFNLGFSDKRTSAGRNGLIYYPIVFVICGCGWKHQYY